MLEFLRSRFLRIRDLALHQRLRERARFPPETRRRRRKDIERTLFFKALKRLSIYFISREKANMKIEVIGQTPDFDKADPRNAGGNADELGGPMIRRVTYTDAKGTTWKSSRVLRM